MKSLKKVLCVVLIITLALQVAGCSQKDKNAEENTLSEVLEESTSERSQTVSLPYIERHPTPDNYESMVGKVSKLPDAANGEIEIRSADLSQADLSGEFENLLLTNYDSKTIWPDNLPEGFNPDKIMEICKDPGLGVRNLHKEGITGKNVGIAIIDQELLTKHEEYANQLKYYSENDYIKKEYPAQMHGAAVASIAVGKTCGVAPEASLYYITENFMIGDFTGRVAEDINELLDLNKMLKDDEKIRVISISWGAEEKEGDGYKELKKAYQRANEEGVFVITTSLLEDDREDIKGVNFIGMHKDKLTDPNDFSVYGKAPWAEEMDLYKTDYLSIPMDNRCVAAPTGVNDYAIFQSGGLSWSVPYLAGVYALACQVKPDIDYKEFWEIALETAVANEKLDTIINPQGIVDKLKESSSVENGN
ncbi:MAG: S8 family serine peptidase [Clostridiales bacterium]|nr:S8 family serine peptidase [Clostridiales bacterium]